MQILGNILWPIAAFGFIGAFVDFLLGKKGQEQVKDSFLRWWVQFDNVHWINFGRKEAEFAVWALEGLFGARLLSFRRIFAAILLYTALIAAGYLLYATAGGVVFFSFDKTNVSVSIVSAFLGVLGFVCAISVSLLFARITRDCCGNQIWRNIVVFSLSTLVNYAAMLLWLPLTSAIKGFALNFVFLITSFGLDNMPVPIISNYLFELKRTHFNALTQLSLIVGDITGLRAMGRDHVPSASSAFLQIAMPLVSYVPTAFRLLISIFFVTATVMAALLVPPVSLIWARLIENEKPVFTLLFSGGAAFAVAIIEIMNHL